MTAKPKTEPQLLELARDACGQCNWTLGECAAEWTDRYAKGRTDADFAKLMGEELGLTSAKVGQCRRVWTDFGVIRGQFPKLIWSHFRAARQLPFTIVEDSLQWANDNESGVSEMLAWVRATHGKEAVKPLEVVDPPEGSGQRSAISDQPEESRQPSVVSGQPEANADSHDDADEEEGSDEDGHETHTGNSLTPDSQHHDTDSGAVHDTLSLAPAKASSTPSKGELTTTVKHLEAVAQVVRLHWDRFPTPLRDRVWSALSVLEQHTRN